MSLFHDMWKDFMQLTAAACPEMKRGKISCVTWSDFLQDADYRAGEVTFMVGTEGG